MQDQYPNLPGILAEFKDGGLVLRNDPNPPATESILILGTAIDGPVMEPVAVDASTAEALFGKAVNPNGTSNGATLVKAFEEAYQAGSRDIRLMRVTGKPATATIKAGSTVFNTDKTKDELLGLAPGNVETTFTLNKNVIDAASVRLKAAGIELAPEAYEVTNGNEEVLDVDGTTVITPAKAATVKLNADVTNSGAEVFITYSFLDGGATVTVTENYFDDAGVAKYYIAEGADTDFVISEEPKAGTVSVYANGIQLSSEAFTVDAVGKKITLHSGFAQYGETLEVSYTFIESITEEPVVKFESVYGGNLYNQLQIEVRNITNAGGTPIGKQILVTKPASKKAQITEPPMSFTSIDFPTFGLLVRAINEFYGNNVVKASVARRYESIATTALEVAPIKNFIGGDDGVNVSKQDLYEALGGKRDGNGFITEPGAYQLLENYSVDMVVPVGVHFDDELAGKYDNFGYQLALACAVMSHRNTATMGIISTTSPEETGLKAIDEHVKHLLSLDLDLYMRDRNGNEILDSAQEKIDLGRYLSVLAGPDVIITGSRTGNYATNSPAIYAGMVSQMPVQSAPTNKLVPGVQGLRFTLSNSQLNALTGKRFVTYKTKQNGAIVAVTDAMTAAQPNSDYRRLVTYRVAKEAVNQIREVADPYIGEPNEVAQRNAMSSAVSKRLDQMKEAGALTDYDFQVIATPEMQLLGQAKIELTIVPPMELRQLTVVVSLSTTL